MNQSSYLVVSIQLASKLNLVIKLENKIKWSITLYVTGPGHVGTNCITGQY